MRSVTPMKTAKIGYIAVSAILCALGIFLIAVPEISAAVLGIVCGIILLIFGVVKLVGFFSRDLYRLAFQYDLAFGLFMIILGAVLLFRPESLMNFICIGISILSDGLFKIQIAIDSKRFGIRRWWLILVFAVLAVIGGGILILRPVTGSRLLIMLIGVTLLIEGILNFSTVITAVKIIKHQQPDEIEITSYEEK